MRPRLLRHPLGDGYDAASVHRAVIGDRDDSVWLDSGADGVSYLGIGRRIELPSPVFPALAAVLAAAAPDGVDADDDAPDFRLGLVGWLGYELRGETTGAAVRHRSRYPDAAFLLLERAIAVDGRTGAAQLLALDRTGDGWAGELAAWRDETAAALTASGGDSGDTPPSVSDAPTTSENPSRNPAAAPTVRWRDDEASYTAKVLACQAAIREGEAYQLCLTTEAEVDTAPDPLELHLRLRASSPTHHGALLRIGGVSLVSASPERFLEVSADRTVSTSPIKGTRPRGADPASDLASRAELLASDKELAENLMIVDLMRNDLSRVCDPATVEVTRLQEVESYAQVHQLVSTVRGRLRDGLTPIDAVAACFPAGSMTGAPKRRATELLDGLEDRARGVYAGAFGVIGFDGRIDLAMVIRSVLVDADGATIGAGGGITALSEPAAEWAEARLKAAPLLDALGVR